MNFNQFLEPRRRGFLLAVLHQSGQQGSAVDVLKSMCHRAGYRVGDDALQVDVVALTDMGLATSRTIGTTQILTITSRGSDVATGQTILPNIERVDV